MNELHNPSANNLAPPDRIDDRQAVADSVDGAANRTGSNRGSDLGLDSTSEFESSLIDNHKQWDETLSDPEHEPDVWSFAEANPVNPVDLANPVDPVDPANPVDPVNPVEPVEPTDPINPVEPTDPHDPVEPTDPHDPVEPTDPHDPVEPTGPHDPVEPTDPHGPVDPVDPAHSVDPADPLRQNLKMSDGEPEGGAAGQEVDESDQATPAQLEKTAAENSDGGKETADQRLSEMRHEGHGPQRHQGDVMSEGDTKLKGRLGDYERNANGDLQPKFDSQNIFVKYKVSGFVDPETGSTSDAHGGGDHYCGPYATAIPDSNDYVSAEQALHRYADSLPADVDGRVIIRPEMGPSLESVLGETYVEKCVGKMLDSDASRPGAPAYKDVDFTNGTLGGVVIRQNDGTYTTTTLFPHPLASNNPLERSS